MFPETRTKFYGFMAAALLLGFVGMEIATTDASFEGSISGMVTGGETESPLAVLSGPGASLAFLLIGVFAGAVIVATAVYIYSVEGKRL